MNDLSAYGFATVALAFVLACVFASSQGMLRFKLPGDTELAMANALIHKKKM